MSRITIIVDDGLVGVDGEFRGVNLSAIDPGIHAVQYDDVEDVGEIEFRDPRRENSRFNGFAQFNRFLTAWENAAPPDPVPPDPDEVRRAQLKAKVVDILVERAAPGVISDIEADVIMDETQLRASDKWKI